MRLSVRVWTKFAVIGAAATLMPAMASAQTSPGAASNENLYEIMPTILPDVGDPYDHPGLYDCGEAAGFTQVTGVTRYDPAARFFQAVSPRLLQDPGFDWNNWCGERQDPSRDTRRQVSCTMGAQGLQGRETWTRNGETVAEVDVVFDTGQGVLTMSRRSQSGNGSVTYHCRARAKG